MAAYKYMVLWQQTEIGLRRRGVSFPYQLYDTRGAHLNTALLLIGKILVGTAPRLHFCAAIPPVQRPAVLLKDVPGQPVPLGCDGQQILALARLQTPLNSWVYGWPL